VKSQFEGLDFKATSVRGMGSNRLSGSRCESRHAISLAAFGGVGAV
jgi:hypothetical protein